MRFLIALFYALFLSINAACSSQASEVLVELPFEAKGIEVFGGDGKPMTIAKEPKLDLKTWYLRMENDESTSTGYAIPVDVDDASRRLSVALSLPLYKRLLDGYKEMATLGKSTKDRALDERFADLALFFDRAWDLKNNAYLVKDHGSRYDYIERFEGLLDAIVVEKAE